MRDVDLPPYRLRFEDGSERAVSADDLDQRGIGPYARGGGRELPRGVPNESARRCVSCAPRALSSATAR
jgi:hypothetical protein